MTTDRIARPPGPGAPGPGAALLDVNVLVALAVQSHQHHRAAHATFSTVTSWATTALTETAFVRLLLNPAVTQTRLDSPQVRTTLGAMRSDPRWFFVADDSSLSEPHIDLSVLQGHGQVTDLHLLNLAVSHGLRLATFDGQLLNSLAPDDRRHVWLWPVS